MAFEPLYLLPCYKAAYAAQAARGLPGIPPYCPVPVISNSSGDCQQPFDLVNWFTNLHDEFAEGFYKESENPVAETCLELELRSKNFA